MSALTVAGPRAPISPACSRPSRPASGPTPRQPALPWRSYHQLLRQRHGATVRRLTVDLGLGCPNRAGGRRGCAFCHERAFAAPWMTDPPHGGTPGQVRGPTDETAGPSSSLAPPRLTPAGLDQLPELRARLERQLAAARRATRARRYVVYLQAGASTWAQPELLDALYRQALASGPDIVGLALGTRPDCLPEAVLDLLAGLARRCDLLVELGLQSAHDATLARLGRGHGWEHYRAAASGLRERGVAFAAHLILGLPGETPPDMLATIQAVAQSGVAAVKLHQLQVLAGTPLAASWSGATTGDQRATRADHGAPPIVPLSEREYIALACDVLEHLPEPVAVMRLVAEGRGDLLLAPRWQASKEQVHQAIAAELARRGSRQGSRAARPGLPPPPAVDAGGERWAH